MEQFFTRWITTTVAVLAAAQLPGIRYEHGISLVLAALLLGIVNALVRPLAQCLPAAIGSHHPAPAPEQPD